MLKEIGETLASLPDETGVYIFYDRGGKVIYVGKARCLRARVRSYFSAAGDGRPKGPLITRNTVRIETVITTDEVEALILENNLIKKHRPRYNVIFRDDKTYPSIVVDMNEPFPTLRIVRNPRERRGVLIFGPFPSVNHLRTTVGCLLGEFRLRRCKGARFAGGRPCLYNQIGECAGPCSGNVDAAKYRRRLDAALDCLKGRSGGLAKKFRGLMDEASGRLEFEKAAYYRDLAENLATLFRGRSIADQSKSLEQDVFAERQSGEYVAVARLAVSAGKLVESSVRVFRRPAVPDEVLEAALSQYYATPGVRIPEQVLLSRGISDADVLLAFLKSRAARNVGLRVPERGAGRELIAMALENARAAIDAKIGADEEIAAGLDELRRMLELSRCPSLIDCFDVSQLHGAHVVGAKVRFVDGKPDKSAYRKYRIKNPLATDDFTAIGEIVSREYDGGEPPDLLVVDGGRGQLSAALAALSTVGLGGVPAVGVAKARKRKMTEERLFLASRTAPIVLETGKPATRLIVRLRDETHRFAITYHRHLRAKAVRSGPLDGIPGIGPKTKRKLVAKFGSQAGVAAAPKEDLLRALGEKTGARIYAALHEERRDEA